MNTGAPWPSLEEAEQRVLAMQTKLHQWAIGDPDRRFDDLYNLVYDPAFLVVAWDRVRSNRGARIGRCRWDRSAIAVERRWCGVAGGRSRRSEGPPVTPRLGCGRR